MKRIDVWEHPDKACWAVYLDGRRVYVNVSETVSPIEGDVDGWVCSLFEGMALALGAELVLWLGDKEVESSSYPDPPSFFPKFIEVVE